eukprot:363464-Chlamydomonas_euryale.AAC.6
MDQTGSARSYPTSTTARCRRDRKAQGPERTKTRKGKKKGKLGKKSNQAKAGEHAHHPQRYGCDETALCSPARGPAGTAATELCAPAAPAP